MNDLENSRNKKLMNFFPKYDIPLKNLFKVEKNKNLLIDLLNYILDPNKIDPIIDVQFFDIEIQTVSAKKAYAINELENFSLEDNEKIIKETVYELEDSTPDFETGYETNNNSDFPCNTKNEKIRKRKRKQEKEKEKEKDFNEKNNKFMKKYYFSGKTARFDSLINGIINNYEQKPTMIGIKNEKIQLFGITKTNRLINIEIQLQNTDNMFKRTVFYASDIMTHSLPTGFLYDEIPSVVMINFLNCKLFKNENKFNWCFSFHDKETKTKEGFE
eukprot:jgi/Orpsp1_1/1182498/evm.model.c7180000081515.1